MSILKVKVYYYNYIINYYCNAISFLNTNISFLELEI